MWHSSEQLERKTSRSCSGTSTELQMRAPGGDPNLDRCCGLSMPERELGSSSGHGPGSKTPIFVVVVVKVLSSCHCVSVSPKLIPCTAHSSARVRDDRS